MRVLLNTECAAIAGGHQSDCEQAVTAAAIVMGAGVGAIVGSAAGGVGVVPGAIAGGSAGSLVADVVAPAVCDFADSQGSDDGYSSDDSYSAGPFGDGAWPGHEVSATGDWIPTGPHMFYVDTSNL